MLNVTLSSDLGIAVLEPVGELPVGDFNAAAELINPYVDANKMLKGVVVYAQGFPGWGSFSALNEHLSFVKEHHRKIRLVDFVTDSALGEFGEKVGGILSVLRLNTSATRISIMRNLWQPQRSSEMPARIKKAIR